MNPDFSSLLALFQQGEIDFEAFEHRCRALFIGEEVGDDAVLDISRESRTGFPEVIYAAGKTPLQVTAIFSRLLERTGRALATRCSPAAMEALQREVPGVSFHEEACLAWKGAGAPIAPDRFIAVLAAGTSDLFVAEEAALTLQFAGARVERFYDLGVAGIHRLLGRLPQLQRAAVIIVTAGMEGALPSVVGGLVAAPVIAVPTSVGYGASLGGIAALLGMLNSCSAGITVVNIDNGFGAAVAALRIIQGDRS